MRVLTMNHDRALSAAQWHHDRESYFDTPEDEPKSPCCQAELSRKGRCYGCGRNFNTMTTIYKYALEITDSQELNLPGGSKLIKVAEQNDQLCAWVLQHTQNEKEDYTIWIAGTGHDLESIEHIHYFDTVLMSGGFVWHVFAEAHLIN